MDGHTQHANQGGDLLLEVEGLTKSFDHNVVLDKIDFNLYPGEVHVLFGENGAGKSTFTKLLCGVYLPNSGQITIEKKKVSIAKPADSRANGIVAVHQDFGLVPQLSVLDNLYLGREFKKNIFLAKKAMYKEARDYFENLKIGFDVDLDHKIQDISMEKRQVVAIARALLQPLKILILDEPTSNFTDRETAILFEHLRQLKKKGVGIIYISHIIEELRTIGDRVTILRDGHIVGHIDNKSEITKDNLLKGMVKRREKKENYRVENDLGVVSLVMKNISTQSGLKNIDVSLKRGEILGIGGLPDSGKTLIGRTIFGIEEITSGEINLHGRDVARILTPSMALKNNIIYFPAEKLEGLALCRDIKENMTLPSLRDKFSRFNFLSHKKEKDAVKDIIDKLSLIPNDMTSQVRLLSGGNQQKVIIARGLLKEAKLFIFDEITRGVDIASKIEFYHIIAEMAKTSDGIVFISSEVSELLDLCHRVIIMYQNSIMGTVNRGDATREKLIHYILGMEVNK